MQHLLQLVSVSFLGSVSVKLHLRDERMERQTNIHVHLSIHSFVRSFVSVRLSILSFRGVPSYGGWNAMLHWNLRGGIKIRDLPISTRYCWLSGKSLKYCHQMSHFNAKVHRLQFLASVRLSDAYFAKKPAHSPAQQPGTVYQHHYMNSQIQLPSKNISKPICSLVPLVHSFYIHIVSCWSFL